MDSDHYVSQAVKQCLKHSLGLSKYFSNDLGVLRKLFNMNLIRF